MERIFWTTRRQEKQLVKTVLKSLLQIVPFAGGWAGDNNVLLRHRELMRPYKYTWSQWWVVSSRDSHPRSWASSSKMFIFPCEIIKQYLTSELSSTVTSEFLLRSVARRLQKKLLYQPGSELNKNYISSQVDCKRWSWFLYHKGTLVQSLWCFKTVMRSEVWICENVLFVCLALG